MSSLVPNELKDAFNKFSQSMDNVDSLISSMLSTPYESIESNFNPIDRSKIDLTVAYTMNSLFWAYLRCSGVDVNETQLPSEIQRIKSQFDRLRQINNRNEQRPKRDAQAAKRMIRHALWQKAHQEDEQEDVDMSEEEETCEQNETQENPKSVSMLLANLEKQMRK